MDALYLVTIFFITIDGVIFLLRSFAWRVRTV